MRIRNHLRSLGKPFLNVFRNELPQTIGRYRILEYIGSGSMGIVYKARDPDLGRTVAIKTIRFDLLSPKFDYTRFLTRFYREARISGALSHPNIVSLYEMGETKDKIPFLAMEYAKGQMLGELLTRDGSFPVQRLLDLLSQIAAGLEYAHGKGVVHRDIKPSNIIVDDKGHVKITDFGIAKLMDTQFTETRGSQLGTPRYMSPEQIMGENLDARSDIFSLGVVAFEMLSGERPFPGPHIAAVLYKIVHRDPIRPSSLERLGFVPERWNELFSKVLAKEASQRFTSAGEFVRALAAVCPNCADAVSAPTKPRTIDPPPAISSNGPTEDETLTLASRLPPRPFRRRWIPGAAAGLALTVGLVSLALLRNTTPEPPQSIMETAGTTPGYRSPWLPSMPVNPPAAATGSISIRTEPPGATVLQNGRERGVTPLELEKLAFGAHSIIIEMETYRTVELAVLLSAEGPQTTLDIPLRPDGGPEATEASTFADAPNQDTVPPELIQGQSSQSLWLAARLRQEGRQLLLRNENSFDWLNVKLEFADPRIALNVERIQAGHTYTIINPSALMPKLINIWCDTPAGKGFYSTEASP
jgi:serine/threonine-protein kinase